MFYGVENVNEKKYIHIYVEAYAVSHMTRADVHWLFFLQHAKVTDPNICKIFIPKDSQHNSSLTICLLQRL